MTSINPAINSLFDAYLVATGFEMTMSLGCERWCQEAVSEGLTPDDITLSIQWRKAFNAKSSAKKSLMLYKMLMDADSRACVLNEAAEMRARSRVRAYAPNKAQALRDAGLPDAPPSPEAKHISETNVIKAIEQLRKAAG